MNLAGTDLYELRECCTATFAVEEVAQTGAHACVVWPCAHPQEVEVSHVAFEHRRHDPGVVAVVWQVVYHLPPFLSPLH